MTRELEAEKKKNIFFPTSKDMCLYTLGVTNDNLLRDN